MIGLIGISYKTSAVETRELFSLSKEEVIPFSELLQKETGISDLVVLSTCNRTEIYFSQDKYEFHLAAKLVYKTLKQFKGIEKKYWHSFYSHSDEKAVKHLFEVASGIDSMILGEDQIIGQIKDAYMHCTEAALTDAVLMRLFQKSFEAGKRVRTETRIKMGTTSVSGAAVQRCISLYNNLSDKRVLMIGAGETGRLVLQNFHKNGSPKITVTNRTEEKAKKLAEKHQCTLMPFEHMPGHLFLYDIVIVATGSKEPLVTREMVEKSLEHRHNSQQVYIDLSVPRNIDFHVDELENVQLYTIDDFNEVINSNVGKRRDSLETAMEIIDEITEDFSKWLSFRSLKPAIQAITFNLQKISKEEVSGYDKVNSEEIQKAIDDFSKHLAQKYTRLFIKNLKEMTANGRKTDTLKLVNELFSLGE